MKYSQKRPISSSLRLFSRISLKKATSGDLSRLYATKARSDSLPMSEWLVAFSTNSLLLIEKHQPSKTSIKS